MSEPRRVRRLPTTIVAAALAIMCVFAAAVALAGCGQNGGEAALMRSLAPTPGPPLPARPGAHVWVVGDPLLAFASADGGATWTTSHPETGEPDPPVFRSVAFGDAEHGWAVGFNTIIATGDGGRTWTTKRLRTSVSLYAVACSDAKHVWAVGGQGAEKNVPFMLASSDGGATWTERHIAISGTLGAVAFADSRHGWVLGDDPYGPWAFILATADGGAHWHLQYKAARGIQLVRVAFADARRGWVVGGNTIYPASRKYGPGLILATRDGGVHWQPQLPGDAATQLFGVAFPNARHGWAVGAGGVIISTKNGGKTWAPQHAGVGDRGLRNVTFSDLTHGWALVDKWGLVATEDGGRTWIVVLPGGPGHVVWDVAALDATPAK